MPHEFVKDRDSLNQTMKPERFWPGQSLNEIPKRKHQFRKQQNIPPNPQNLSQHKQINRKSSRQREKREQEQYNKETADDSLFINNVQRCPGEITAGLTCSGAADCSDDSRTRSGPSRRTRSSGRSGRRAGELADGRIGNAVAFRWITPHAFESHRSPWNN